MIKCTTIGDRKIVIFGVGKMFYQEGFPISMSVSEFKKKGIEVSIYHAADECLKNGWSSDTVCKKFREDFADIGEKLDLDKLKHFCECSYEESREIIFQYLYGFSSQEALQNKEKREELTKYLI